MRSKSKNYAKQDLRQEKEKGFLEKWEERQFMYLPNTIAVSAVVPEELLTVQSSAKARSAC